MAYIPLWLISGVVMAGVGIGTGIGIARRQEYNYRYIFKCKKDISSSVKPGDLSSKYECIIEDIYK